MRRRVNYDKNGFITKLPSQTHNSFSWKINHLERKPFGQLLKVQYTYNDSKHMRERERGNIADKSIELTSSLLGASTLTMELWISDSRRLTRFEEGVIALSAQVLENEIRLLNWWLPPKVTLWAPGWSLAGGDLATRKGRVATETWQNKDIAVLGFVGRTRGLLN